MTEPAGQPESTRAFNLARLFALLCTTRIVSRAQLAKETGLSRTAISALCEDVLRVGLAEEIGLGGSTGGRPPTLLRFNPEAALALGAQMTQGDWTLVAVNLDGQVHHRLQVVAGTNPVAAVDALRQGLESMRAELGPRRVLPAIGLGTPGLVDPRQGMIKAAFDVGWIDVPLRDMAEQALGVKAFVANRSKVGALAEHYYGAGRGRGDLIYVAIGSGIAAGIVHQGHLYVGANCSAGELGHTTVVPDGPQCPCGNRGCLQEFASGPAIAQRARARLRDRSGGLLEELAGNLPELLTAEMVLDAAKRGDPLAMEIVLETAQYLGIAIANLVNLFNPEFVVLGGPVGRAGQVLLEPLQAEVRRRAMAYPLSATHIVTSALGPDASAIGAATLVLQQASRLIFAGEA